MYDTSAGQMGFFAKLSNNDQHIRFQLAGLGRFKVYTQTED